MASSVTDHASPMNGSCHIDKGPYVRPLGPKRGAGAVSERFLGIRLAVAHGAIYDMPIRSKRELTSVLVSIWYKG